MIASSDYPRGRVVAIGAAPGAAEAGAYRDLLWNAVQWAGGGPRCAIDESRTRSGLLAAVEAAAEEAERLELAPFLALPNPRFDEKIMDAYIFKRTKPEQLRALVRHVKAMGFDGLIVNSLVKKLSYPSRYYDNAGMSAPFDQLAVVVEECKKQGLKYGFCVAPFLPVRGGREPEDLPRNIPKKDYLEGRQLRPEYWACPDHPGVQQRGLDAVREQLETYQPDYPNLDYIRYIEGYEASCYCAYSRARKEDFAAAHPDLGPDAVDAAFARQVLTAYARDWHDLCKRAAPRVKTIVYTMTPDVNDATWLFTFPADWHTKYVSRGLTGAWRSIGTVGEYTRLYDGLNRAGNPVAGSEFLPMLAGKHGLPGERTKSPLRLEAELKALSAAMDRLPMKRRAFKFYVYNQIMDEATFDVLAPYADMFRKVLGGPASGPVRQTADSIK